MIAALSVIQINTPNKSKKTMRMKNQTFPVSIE